MFDKRTFISHTNNTSGNQKMVNAGVKTPFFNEISEAKYGKKITKSHNKEYPKGTHLCATHVEHAEWGQGKPIHGEHAAPDADGNIAWYNVMFEHGIERVNTADVKVLAEAKHANHEHHDSHDHPGENLEEQQKISLSDLVAALAGKKMGQKYPGRGGDPTDHHTQQGKPRQGEDRYDRLKVAQRYKLGKMLDPDFRRSDALDSSQDLY